MSDSQGDGAGRGGKQEEIRSDSLGRAGITWNLVPRMRWKLQDRWPWKASPAVADGD